MENLLDLIETTAKESLKGLEGSDKEDLENLLLDIEDQRTIENKISALTISLDQFAEGLQEEREDKSSLSRQDIEAHIHALRVVLALINYVPAKLST